MSPDAWYGTPSFQLNHERIYDHDRQQRQPPRRKTLLRPDQVRHLENTPTDPDKKHYFTATFTRSYQDEQCNWQDTQSFGLSDLLALSKLADQAHTAMHQRMRANNGNARTTQDQHTR